jgi:hypothetical protein
MVRYISLLLFIGLAWGQNPCEDLRYKDIKKKSLDEMSDREYEYFMMKEKGCMSYNSSNTIVEGAISLTDTVSRYTKVEVIKESGFSFGVAPSISLVSGETFTNVPMGATLVITTPYGFKLGPLDFTISAAFGGYQGEHAGDVFNPTVMGVGGNLTLASLVFAEGHAGIVGEGTGIRGFAGVSLEYLMKKGLNLPVNILVGGEGFISTNMAGAGNSSGWGGLGVRLDYDF